MFLVFLADTGSDSISSRSDSLMSLRDLQCSSKGGVLPTLLWSCCVVPCAWPNGDLTGIGTSLSPFNRLMFGDIVLMNKFFAGIKIPYLERFMFDVSIEFEPRSPEEFPRLEFKWSMSFKPEKIPVSWLIPFLGTGTQKTSPRKSSHSHWRGGAGNTNFLNSIDVQFLFT